MAATLTNTALTLAIAMALPRAIAKLPFPHFHTSLYTLSTIPHHHYHHNSPQIYSKIFSSTYEKYHIRVRNICRVSYVEEETSRVSDVISSPGLVALEYADLNLPQYCEEEVNPSRIRQHVNPLSSAFSVPAEVPDWSAVFKDSSLPLVVDVGCGSGRFLLWLAKRKLGSNNYLGLEIRKKLVMRSNFWATELGLSNAHFMFANATVSFQQLVSSYPGPLVLVSILCPDPHFKKRHHKRRVLQKQLVDSIIENLIPGGQVFVQSDVLDVALDMRNQLDSVADLLHIDAIDPHIVCDPDGWLLSNPMGIRTEREIHAELEGSQIYRRMYQKSQ